MTAQLHNLLLLIYEFALEHMQLLQTVGSAAIGVRTAVACTGWVEMNTSGLAGSRMRLERADSQKLAVFCMVFVAR